MPSAAIRPWNPKRQINIRPTHHGHYEVLSYTFFMLNYQSAPRILAELDRALTIESAKPARWLVCGGVALALQGLTSRSTSDLDVIGSLSDIAFGVTPMDGFPTEVLRAIDRVALSRPELQTGSTRWVNLGASGLLRFGLPDGLERRVRVLVIGPQLTLLIPSRSDLVALKLFAAIDPVPRRQPIHKSDLGAMSPSRAELESAIEWIRRIPDPNDQLMTELRELLLEFGHDDLAYNLP